MKPRTSKLILLSISLLILPLLVSCRQKEDIFFKVATVADPAEGGSVVATPSGQVLEGTEVTFTATPSEDYEFQGWGGSLSGKENPKTVKVTADLEVKAFFGLRGSTAQFVSGLSTDAAIFNGAGGESVVSVTTGAPWRASSSQSWLKISPPEGGAGTTMMTITTAKNSERALRPAVIKVVSGADVEYFSVIQRPYIFTRAQMGSKVMTNAVRVTYDGSGFSRFYCILPVPKNNQYQEIKDFEASPAGSVVDCPDGVNSYVVADITSDIPASGSDILKETFLAEVYALTANLAMVTEIPEYDPASAPCRDYLGVEEYGLVDPTHPQIVSTAASLWSDAKGDLIDYARKCYEWTATNMTYGNKNTGLHTVEELMKTKLGDCGNFCSVFISLLRAKGIPARHIVMISPQESGYHVRAEFYIPAYGWIPADPTFKHDDPVGDYFGKFSGRYIIMSLGINPTVKDPEGVDVTTPLLQNYLLWTWYSGTPYNVVYSHVFSRF